MDETNSISQTYTGSLSKSPLPSGLVLSNKWEILGRIASGGKGDIYRAHQINLERTVALKVISPDFVESYKDNPDELASEMERFRREVRIMAGVHHPNVLQVYDYDTTLVNGDELEYLVMEYIDGETLRSAMPKDGLGLDSRAVAKWIRDYYLPILHGVVTIHDAGILHRDLKPENILLDGRTPKITDFGLAKVLQQPGLTNTSHILGTIFYMPKEQFEDGAGVDSKADVYALGKILYEAVTGKITKASRVIFKEVGLPLEKAPKSSEDFFRKLDDVIRGATREEPGGRTASVALMIESLRTAIAPCITVDSPQSPPTRERGVRRLFVAIIALVLALTAFASYHFWEEARMRREMGDRADAEAPLLSSPVAREQSEQFLITGDGATLRLMPGGKKKWLPTHGGTETISLVPSFYAEESLVSNQRFVAFLNEIRENVTVRENTVLLQGMVIYMLGETREGSEPIKFRDGKFILQERNGANEPVVRVSADGAQAYARHYGRELPDTAQWLTAREQGLVASLPLAEIKEWGMVRFGTKEQFYVFENFTDESTLFCPLERQKWEAFADVGFRTVLHASQGPLK